MSMSYIFRTFVFIFFTVYVLLVHTSGLILPVYSQTIPSFTSCTNPQGSIRADYPSGTHGIAGETATYSGKDTVYTLSGSTLTQCFCSTNGDGIQTNWWKASSLTPTEISILEREGWIYIPNGVLWGLDQGPYMAKNSTFSCPSSSSGGSSSTTSSSNTSESRVGGASATNDNTNNVLGLAATGNIQMLLFFLFGGFFFLFLALFLKRRNDSSEQ